MKNLLAIVICLFVWSGVSGVECSSSAQTLEWTRQLALGGTGNSWHEAVSTDGQGVIYVAGGGSGSDGHLAKYDSSGNVEWALQLGFFFETLGVSADGLGAVYVAGRSADSVHCTDKVVCGRGPFVRKYDDAGNVLWSRAIDPQTEFTNRATAVSADDFGNVYVVGATYNDLGGANVGARDVFLAKYDGIGNMQWIEQFGSTEQDEAKGVSTDILGNVFVAGSTRGDLAGINAGSDDAFLAKYDSSGQQLWIRQIGTSGMEGFTGTGGQRFVRVAADGQGGAYIAGPTTGSLGGTLMGSSDVFLTRYDATGDLIWTRQIGTPDGDYGAGIVADNLGNVYVSGASGHAFVNKFDSDGNSLWHKNLGASTIVRADVSMDDLGAVYLAGGTSTADSLSPGSGVGRAYIAKLSPTSGDFDFDGDVDGNDFLAWQRNPNVGDLADWQANFGAADSLASSVQAPEPTGVVLATLLLVLVSSHKVFSRERSDR